MILDFCHRQCDALRTGTDPEDVRANREALEELDPPFGLGVETLQPFLASALLALVCEQGGNRTLPFDGHVVRRIERIREPSQAEYARLISKGRLLYEHCMAEVSHACMVGFMDHELTKCPTAERVVLDLLGWMFLQRQEFAGLEPEEGEGALLRVAHADYMLDHGVSYLHGLTRTQADRLAADKEPL